MSTSRLPNLLADWQAESTSLGEILYQLTEAQWNLLTPSPGWTIKHQVAHLEWTERMVLLSLTDAAGFAEVRQAMPESSDLFVDEAAQAGARGSGHDLLRGWQETQAELGRQLSISDPGQRIEWFGPAMGVATVLSARIMETFAHGQDIRDALGIAASGSDRLRHIAHLAIAARNFSFSLHQLRLPEHEFRIELEFGAEQWTWGPEQASERITGQALDFCLLATRRRHRGDCAVTAQGEFANLWLNIIQAYAGSPGEGRAALTTG